MAEQKTKVCKKCHKEKSIRNFKTRSSLVESGYNDTCRHCIEGYTVESTVINGFDHRKVSEVINVFPGGVVTREQQEALFAFERKVKEALIQAKVEGVPQGFIVALIHSYDVIETQVLIDGEIDMKFEIGEIAIYVDPAYNRLFEVEIMSEYLENQRVFNWVNHKNEIDSGYDIKSEELAEIHNTDPYWFASKQFLRKKQPPQELGSWEALKDIWQPNTIDA